MSMVQASIMKLAGHWSARQISVLLTVVALILWAYSIIQAKLDIGFYGLIHSFPVIFFVALGILTVASAILWFSRENQEKLLFLQLCFLVVAIWLAPVIVGGAQPLLSESYYDMGRVEYIVREGHVSQELLWDHAWPAGWTFWASITQVAGITTDDLAGIIRFVPLMWQFLILLPLFMFFRNTIGKSQPNYCWAAMWLFCLGCWSDVLDTGAHAFGVFFAFAILALLTIPLAGSQRISGFGQRATAIILLGVSAITHLLGSLVSLAITAALYFSRRMVSSNLVIMAAVFIAAWSIYGAMGFFEARLPGFIEQGFRLGQATERGIVDPLSGSESHVAVSTVRIAYAGLFVALALLGAILARKLRSNTHIDKTVLAIIVSCALLAVLVGTGYGHNLYQRFFIFLLPAIVYFGAKLLHLRATAVIFCIVVLIALPLAFVSIYGNQKIDYLSPGYLAGAHFFQEHTTHGHVTGEWPIGRMKNQEWYGFYPSLKELEWEDDKLIYEGRPRDFSPHYISIGNHERAIYSFYHNEPQFIDEIEGTLDAGTYSSLVFANPDLNLYIHEKEE